MEGQPPQPPRPQQSAGADNGQPCMATPEERLEAHCPEDPATPRTACTSDGPRHPDIAAVVCAGNQQGVPENRPSPNG